jgi:hypothetical protein
MGDRRHLYRNQRCERRAVAPGQRAPTGRPMPSSRDTPPLETYLAALSRLRGLTSDQLEEESDRLTPIWAPLKVVPGL